MNQKLHLFSLKMKQTKRQAQRQHSLNNIFICKNSQASRNNEKKENMRESIYVQQTEASYHHFQEEIRFFFLNTVKQNYVSSVIVNKFH